MRIEGATGLHGSFGEVRRKKSLANRHPMFKLEYAKRSSTVLLPLLYPAGAPSLERKRDIWTGYERRHAFGKVELSL